jgi:peptidyl-prolyl cis-trans isomerase C
MHFIPALMEIEVVEEKPHVPLSSSIDAEILSTTSGVRSPLRRFSGEPLVHFLLAGIVLFAVSTLFERQTSGSKTIHVTSAEIQRLQDVWSRQYGRNPSSAELRNLIDDYIREEIYYREAMASGLDKGDSIIRRRLVEKMEFLSQEVAAGDPDEAELQAYFQKNRQKFEVPAQIAFSHIFFSPSKRGASLQSDAQNALNQLRLNKAVHDSQAGVGDPFMLQSEYPLQTRDEVKALFGAEFAEALFSQHREEWFGPVPSSYGLHLVRITRLTPAHLPQLAEIRSKVLTDFKNERLQVASERYYAGLRKHYHIGIENGVVAQGLSPSYAPTRPIQKVAPDED